MADGLDLCCSCAVVLIAASSVVAYGVAATEGEHRSQVEKTERARAHDDRLRGAALPTFFTRVALWVLAPVARTAIRWGVSANAITSASLGAGVVAGVLLAEGHFGVAALVFVVASLGDALDGLVARATTTESGVGALFDASADRYEEFFVFAGLAMFLRESAVLLALVLLALLGAFMVSYGSAKAESLHVPVPDGSMRRAERAALLTVGATLVPIAAAIADRLRAPPWVAQLPIVLAALAIAVRGNLSAARRLHTLAAAVSRTAARRERSSMCLQTAARGPVGVDASAGAE